MVKINKYYFIFIFLIFIGISFFSKNIPFISDDLGSILNFDFSHLPKITDFFETGWVNNRPTWAYRPFLFFTYYLTYLINGFDTYYFRLVNILIYFLICIQVFYIVKKRASINLNFYLIFSSFVFSVILWHSVLYISARSTLIVALFILNAIYLSETEKKFYFLLPALMAIITKETGILAFILPLIINFKSIRIEFKKIEYKKTLYTALLIISLFIIIFKIETIKNFYKYTFLNDSVFDFWIKYIVTQFANFIIYLKLFLTTSNWAFFHDVSILEIDKTTTNIILVAIIIFWIIVFWNVFKSKSEWIKFLCLGFITFLPEFIYPRAILLNEQRLFLPAIFWFMSLILLFNDKKSSYWIFFSSLFFIINIFSLYSRISIYQTSESIYLHDIQIYPKHRFVMPMLAESYFVKNNLIYARKYFEITKSNWDEIKTLSKFDETEIAKTYLRLSQIYLSESLFPLNQALIKDCYIRNFSSNMFCKLFEIMEYNLKKEYDNSFKTYKEVNSFLPILELEILKAQIATKHYELIEERINRLNQFFRDDAVYINLVNKYKKQDSTK